jgi:hypothetical protein
VTIRAKLIAAIALTVIGPVVTIGVALAAFASLGDHFDDVAAVSRRQALALQLKFAVTDMNGWQTAYGYDGGRSRPRFERSAATTRALLAAARRALTTPPEREQLRVLGGAYDDFMRLDDQAWSALQDGRPEVTKRILLGPEIRHFEAMAGAAGTLAAGQRARVRAAERGFDEARDSARRELVAVGIGAAVVIVLLLITVQDVVRLALERRAE